ncbi:MAG: stage II sporulation protein P, partial [Bacillota bacterium]
MSLKKYKIIIIFVIVIILIFLNIKKYREINDNTAVPVWSSYDDQYYESRPETGFLDKLANTFNPDRLVYGMTKVRLRAPITYLKREIPLLAYYTPEELKKPTETIYQPGSRKNNMIELKFDLREDNKENETQTKITDNSKSEDNKIKDPTDKQNNNQLPDRPENRADENERIPINGEKPVIAIYHTHNSETYIDDPRHQDDNGHVLPGNIGNVGKVGMEVARILSEEYKFRVIHTTKIHDTKYSMSYYNSRKTVKELLSNYPEIDLLLDIHRDGIKANVSKDDITAVLNRQRIANVMVVVGNGKYKINTTND